MKSAALKYTGMKPTAWAVARCRSSLFWIESDVDE